MTFISRSTMSPPLKAAIGVWRSSGSISISIPRGGRPLVTAKRMPASTELVHRVDGLVGEDLVLRHQRSVHVGQQHADRGRSHATFFQDRRTVG